MRVNRTLTKGATAVAVSIGLGLSGNALADKPSFAGASPDVLNAANNCIVRFKDDVPRADVSGRARGLLARANC